MIEHNYCALSPNDKRLLLRKKHPYSKQDMDKALRWAKKILACQIMGGKCKKCGYDNFFALSFHHRSDNKVDGLHRLFDGCWDVIQKELNKCDMLCLNCHYAEHSENDMDSKIELMKHIDQKVCVKCGYVPQKLNCFCFHHRDSSKKDFMISRRCRKGRPLNIDLCLKEIKKCDLLCHNCHQIEHTQMNQFNRLKPLIDKYVKLLVEEKDKEYKQDFRCLGGIQLD